MSTEFLIDINHDMELPEYELVLCKLTGEPIQQLWNITNLSYSAYYVGIDELSFNIPLYRMTSNGEKVKNEIYDLVDGEYLILVNNKKYFIIDNITEEAGEDGVYKSVHCYSREYELIHKKLVNYQANSRVIYDPMDTMLDGLEKGILNYIFKYITKSWTVDYVDPDLLTKHRALEFYDSNLIQVFQTLQETYNCIFKFDTIEQTVSIYSVDNILGEHRGLYISDENFIKEISKDINYSNIKTRLYLYGQDNISIQSISPTGQPYIDNFDSYKNTKFMSQELIDTLNKYEAKIESYQGQFSDLLQQLDEANEVLDELYNADSDNIHEKGLVALKTYLTILQNSIDTKIEEIATIQELIKEAEDEELQELHETLIELMDEKKELLEEKETVLELIETKEEEIETQEELISTIRQQIIDLQNELSMSANFTEELIQELDKFIRVETYINTDYTENNVEELLEEGQKILNRISQPQIQFDVDVVDFLNVVECQHVWDKFVLGDIVTLEYQEIGFNYDVRLVGYEHDVDSNSLQLKFSNTYTLDDATLYLNDLLDSYNSVTSIIDFSKYEWDKVGDVESSISKYIDEQLENARQNILNAVGQKYLFNDNGLWLYKMNEDGSIDDAQIRAINNTIALTTDNWATITWALDPSGINAEIIRGKLGEFAFVAANQIVVGDNGETIPDEAIGDNIIRQNKYYNGIVINSENGFVATRNDGLVQTIVNATEGFSIKTRITTSSSWNDVVNFDTEGNLTIKGRIEADEGYFKGDITGATGTFTGVVNASDYRIDGVSILDSSNKIKGNYINSITTDQLVAGTSKISTALIEDLVVGQNVTMGDNATITWENISNKPRNLAYKEDIPDDEYITIITRNTITTSYINALNVRARELGTSTDNKAEVVDGGFRIYNDNEIVFEVGLDTIVGARIEGFPVLTFYGSVDFSYATVSGLKIRFA